MKPDLKKLIVLNIPYVIIWYLVDKLCWLYRMAEGTLAGENCTYSIITEEDFGEEDVNKICREIGDFVGKAGGRYEIVTDREEAVRKAITLMDDDTILFIPGKGRETRLKRGLVYEDCLSDVDLVRKYL